jgi:Cu(I)/Ag(I) efflux system protein CusF
MKPVKLLVGLALVASAALASAQSGGMKGMEMKGDMKGMDTKGMEMDKGSMSKGDKAQTTHKAVGVVRNVDPKAGTVTLAHEPVKTLNWPAMNMTFKVQDKAVLDKFAEGKKVEVEFQERGKDHVITGVK